MKKEEGKNFEVIKLNTRYASQSLSEIPVGYWIDKSVGGCGLSYLALTDKTDSIILMPRNKLIENKEQQKSKYKNLFIVNNGVSKEDVYTYIQNSLNARLPIKILSTYNSFALGKLDFLLENNICKIYLDESQFLLEFAVSFPSLVNELHKRLESNISITSFFSAHPPKREYLPEYIQNMPSIKYIWENQVRATPYIIDTNQPYRVVNIILDQLLTKGKCTLNDLTFKKVIVFINSVDGIRRIIEPLNSKENIAYVVGDTVRNDSKLNEFAHSLEDCSKLPIITLGTTSLISGFDLYDNDTLNIVISTSTKEFTLMDKELDVPQAITRQRLDSNPFNDKFIFIVDVKDMESKIEGLEDTFNKDVIRIGKVVDNLNYLKEGNKDYTIGYELYQGYYNFTGETFTVNASLLLARKYVFEQLYTQYKDGYNVMSTNIPGKVSIVNFNDFYATSYMEYVTKYNEAGTIADKLKVLNSIHKLEWKEIMTYGIENGKILSNIKSAREFYESRNDYKGITLSIRKAFKVGTFYSNEFVKKTLQEIYSKKGLSRTAKANDLFEFFEISATSKRDGLDRIKGLTIIKSK